MIKHKPLKLKRILSKAELRHIITRIWGLSIDFETLREFNDTDRLYSDAVSVIEGTQSIDSFSSEYICDTYDDLDFIIVYDTLRYLKKRGAIEKL